MPNSSDAPPSLPVASPASSVRSFALLLVAGREARGELRLGARGLAPALDAAGGLEPRYGGDEMRAREVVRRRERLAVGSVRALLGHRRRAERAPDGDAAERARLAPELTRDDGSISVGDHGGQHDFPHAACAATAGCP